MSEEPSQALEAKMRERAEGVVARFPQIESDVLRPLLIRSIGIALLEVARELEVDLDKHESWLIDANKKLAQARAEIDYLRAELVLARSRVVKVDFQESGQQG